MGTRITKGILRYKWSVTHANPESNKGNKFRAKNETAFDCYIGQS